MARKLRLEYPGAIYHVINRGNYRSWVFETQGAKQAFEACLFKACARSGWILHAYVIMGNHYHLAIETPKGNLVAGMQWLQATFANRFNRLRKVNGHLFQGRYKALLVEEGDALGMLCDYIHLNPVRASLVPTERMTLYRYSSYWYLRRKTSRPPFLDPSAALVFAGGLADNKIGWTVYERYLQWQAEEGPAGKNKAYVNLSSGWALGTKGFKQALLKDHAEAAEARAWDAKSKEEIGNLRWQAALDQALASIPVRERTGDRKSAAWKVAVAVHLKETTDAPNNWIAQNLKMGSGRYVAKHVGLGKKPGHAAAALIKIIEKGVR